ncbi:hypothetical protein CgS9114_02238 [Corynebacterium glutamicum S9114]|nr:hypothetical protein CgS9114_02238 [Corynebacterium glutamicum S9114]
MTGGVLDEKWKLILKPPRQKRLGSLLNGGDKNLLTLSSNTHCTLMISPNPFPQLLLKNSEQRWFRMSGHSYFEII